jgi:ATP-dependent exoDNAse (exonuclease V) alpha subunit
MSTGLVLSTGQAAGVDMVGKFLAQDKILVAVITGFAGTGKTTLIRELADSYGEPKVLAPTGKAALRVGQATGIFAGTIHKFLYEPTEDPKTGEPVFKMKDLWDEDLTC